MTIWDRFKYIITNKNFYIPIIICLVLVAFGYFSKITMQNNMKVELFNFFGMKIDWWSISHLVLYIYFGYHFPQYFVEFLVIGTLWEIFESSFCKESFAKLIGCQGSNNSFCQKINKIRGCDYWYGKVDDIVVNIIGFVIGAMLAKKFRKN